MGEISPVITTLHNLLIYDARKFSSAEIQLRNVLPRWADKASSEKLKDVLQRYFDYVSQHAHKIESFIEAENILSLSTSNKIMKAFIDEAEEKLANCADSEVRDACLLAAIQEINHFKISSYGTAAAFSRALHMNKHAEFFHEAEVSEKQIDDRLSQLAEFEINDKATTPIMLPD